MAVEAKWNTENIEFNFTIIQYAKRPLNRQWQLFVINKVRALQFVVLLMTKGCGRWQRVRLSSCQKQCNAMSNNREKRPSDEKEQQQIENKRSVRKYSTMAHSRATIIITVRPSIRHHLNAMPLGKENMAVHADNKQQPEGQRSDYARYSKYCGTPSGWWLWRLWI